MKTLKLYQTLQKLPLGKPLFSKIVCFKAPYFSSISPKIVELRPGYCEILLKKRRSILNHINTIHAIAMCNAAELAAGMMTDVSIPSDYKWIPSGMTVKYLHKAKTSLTAIASDKDIEWVAGNIVVPVILIDESGKTVFQAEITMHIKQR